MDRPTRVAPLADGFGPEWAEAWGVDGRGVYAEFTVSGETQRMRYVAPGRFRMGSGADEAERSEKERPHEVVLTRGYWVADTACTQGLWEAVLGTNPSRFVGRRRPVENVSWEDCQEFLGRINALRPGLDLRLLTEAEWECACRAGTHTPFSFGPTITTDQVNYDGHHPYAGGQRDRDRGETVDVASLPPNAWGLYEMHGNVMEWCNDWYGEYPLHTVTDPRGPDDGYSRVLRGGSWIDDARCARSACRNYVSPKARYGHFGVRIARGHE